MTRKQASGPSAPIHVCFKPSVLTPCFRNAILTLMIVFAPSCDLTAQSSAISLLGRVSLIEYSNFHAPFLLCSPDPFAHVLILIHGRPVCHLILVPLVDATWRWLNKGKVNALYSFLSMHGPLHDNISVSKTGTATSRRESRAVADLCVHAAMFVCD